VLGAEKEIIARYVTTGEVKIVHWPITDIGQRAVDAMAAAYCVGEHSVDAYWRYHDLLYENYSDTYRNDRAYLVDKAVSVGADQAAFEACYDAGEAHDLVLQLNQQRKNEGINQRPTYDINGQKTFGVQSFELFDGFIQLALSGG
jgi:protein-disulfide isomerase